MTEIDRDETSEETIHNLRIICKCKQEEIERLQQRVEFQDALLAGDGVLLSENERLQQRIAELEQHGEPVAWQPIETAPDVDLVVVGWTDGEDGETRYDFDHKVDGCWVRHEDLYQEFCAVAPPGSHGPKAYPPYTHHLTVPPLPSAPSPEDK